MSAETYIYIYIYIVQTLEDLLRKALADVA